MRKIYVFLLLLALISVSAFAQPKLDATVYKETLNTVLQQLRIERQQNMVGEQQYQNLLETKKSKWDKLKPKDVTKDQVDSQKLAVAVAQADYVNAQQVLSDANDKLNELRQTTKALESSLQKARIIPQNNKNIERLELDLDYLNTHTDLQYQRVIELQKAAQLADSNLKLNQLISRNLTELYHTHQNYIRERSLLELSEKVQQEKALWLKRISELNVKLSQYQKLPGGTQAQTLTLQTELYQATQELYLEDLKLSLNQMNDRVQDFATIPNRNLSIAELDASATSVVNILLNLQHFESRIDAKLNVIENKLAILDEQYQEELLSKQDFDKNKQILDNLAARFNEYKKFNSGLKTNALRYQESIRSHLTAAIARRQGLPGFDLYAWQLLGSKLLQIPRSSYNLFSALSNHIAQGIRALNWWQITFMSFLTVAWIALYFLLRQQVKRVLDLIDNRRDKASANIAFVTLQLVKRNLIVLAATALVVSYFLYLGIPFNYYRFLFYLVCVWLCFRFVLGIARLSLVETMSNVSGHDVLLYKRLRMVFIFGGTVTALAVMAQQLSVAYEVRDIFNRFFMLFLMILSLVLFKARHVVPRLLAPMFENRRPYVHRAIKIVSTLLPLTLLSNALVGLFGYVQLAWVMSYYQMVILVVLFGYVVARGLLIDLMSLSAELSIRYLQNGWLLTQAFLKPIDRVLRLALLAFTFAIIAVSFQLTLQSPIIKQLWSILNYKLVSFTGGSITLLSMIEFTILVMVVFWAARWTREFAYRWLFREINDLGIRNSLAVFSQYIMAILGSIITLRVLGIDFSGLSYILGGLAVGLGFGLRDLTNNIVSGVMLLIERPVREGDLISVDKYEGTVTHIGIRSMTVRSWDHMEVMIPNSETFNKSFTNWTHQDSIVRTVIPIKIHRRDNPVLVQELIFNLLQELPTVLNDPSPQVFLKEIDDVLIELEVRYFINLDVNSRVQVRSQVLFAIWERFQANNIRPPYPQQDVQILSGQLDALPGFS